MMKKGFRIAFCGKAFSGKDTAANFLSHYADERLAFADPIKDAIKAAFPGIKWNRYGKNEIIPEIGKSQRELWQMFGDGFGRKGIREDIWVDQLFRRLAGKLVYYKKIGSNFDSVSVLITDVRRENEAERCKAEGFTVVKVVRSVPHDCGEWSKAESETDVDLVVPDITIMNDGTLNDLQQKCLDICLPGRL